VRSPSIDVFAAQLRAGAVSAVAEAKEALAAAARVQPELRAFITVSDELALEHAAGVDAELTTGVDRGPLMGVPVAVKDVFDTTGVRTTYGWSALHDRVPATDAVVVRQLREAGAVVIGKTNLPEFAYGLPSPQYGRANNPRDARRSAGGSSGGSAAAVGAGVVPAALGTDSGGSVRHPAALCGVVGLKPTFGRISLHGAFSPSWSLDHCGVIARSVADVRRVFEVLTTTSADSRRLAQPPSLAAVTGWSERLQPEVARALEQAVAQIEAAGASVGERAIPDIEHFVAPFMLTFVTEAAVRLEPWLATSSEQINPLTRRTLALAADIRATDYVRAQRYRSKLLHSVEEALRDLDVLVTATLPVTAQPDEVISGDLKWETVRQTLAWTAPFNLTGNPAITLPVPVDGMPVGLQLIGARGADEGLLDVAEWIERSLAST
jgi:aspartyl-tRNA(Asn)/glutamyl-tRNA(Gln) amidotransferase subunit A